MKLAQVSRSVRFDMTVETSLNTAQHHTSTANCWQKADNSTQLLEMMTITRVHYRRWCLAQV